MAKLNGAAKWVAIGVVIALAVMTTVLAYGRLTIQVEHNKDDIAEIKPVLTKLLVGQERIKTLLKGLKQ